MNIVQEINAMVKQADPVYDRHWWDWITSPLTSLYAKQNENFRKQQAEAAVNVQMAPKTAPSQAPVRRKDPNEAALRSIAQGVSNCYRKGSIARPKFVSGGRVVAR